MATAISGPEVLLVSQPETLACFDLSEQVYASPRHYCCIRCLVLALCRVPAGRYRDRPLRRSPCELRPASRVHHHRVSLAVFVDVDQQHSGKLIDKAVEDAVGLVYRRLGLQPCLGERDLVRCQRAELIESGRERGRQVACHRIGIEPSQCVENLVCPLNSRTPKLVPPCAPWQHTNRAKRK